MFEHLSALTARPFATRDEAIAAVLDILHRVPGLRTSFVARIDQGQFEVVAVDSRGGRPFEVGTTLPLEDVY